MVFQEREGLKESGGRREREELWDLQENRESKVSRETLALKESREKKVNDKITMIIIIMTKVKLNKKKMLWSKTITMMVHDDSSNLLLFYFSNFFIFICVYIFSSFHLQHCLMLRVRISRYIQRGSSESTRVGEEFFFNNRTIIKPFFLIVVKLTLHI